MGNVKRGYIVQILREEGLGVIRENDTMTEWIYFLGDLSRRQNEELKVMRDVTFYPDNNFEQFVAIKIELDHNRIYKAV
jgi:hypothetical protein